jgi:hypothetical protein
MKHTRTQAKTPQNSTGEPAAERAPQLTKGAVHWVRYQPCNTMAPCTDCMAPTLNAHVKRYILIHCNPTYRLQKKAPPTGNSRDPVQKQHTKAPQRQPSTFARPNRHMQAHNGSKHHKSAGVRVFTNKSMWALDHDDRTLLTDCRTSECQPPDEDSTDVRPRQHHPPPPRKTAEAQRLFGTTSQELLPLDEQERGVQMGMDRSTSRTPQIKTRTDTRAQAPAPPNDA